MTAELLLEAALKSAAVSALTLMLLRLARGRCAAERSWIAHVGILLALAAPAFALFGPDLEVAWLPASAAADMASSMPLASPKLLAAGGPAAAQGDLAAPRISGLGMVMLAYGIVAATILLGLFVGTARLLVLQRRASVLTDQPWLSALAHAQQRMGFKHGAALLVSDDIASPVSWGFFRPTILLNRKALQAPDQAEGVIAHELAHVVRLDWANLMLARIGAAVLWFNPLVWMLAREAHQLREEAADDAVLRGALAGPEYATLLLHVARHESRGALLAANGVAPGLHSLKRRLVRVLDPNVARDPVRPGWRAAAAALALAVTGPLAAFTPVAASMHTAPTTGAMLPDEGAAAQAAAPQTAVLVTSTVTQAAAATSSAAAEMIVPAPPPLTALPSAASATDQPMAPLARLAAPALIASRATAVAASQAPPMRAPSGDSPRLSPEVLTQMRIHGVTPEWIAALEAEVPGIRQAPAEKLVNLAVHRVRPAWLRELKAAGYGDLTVDEIASLAVHRVNADYVRELAAAGYRNLPVAELLSMRIHGVDADYVRRMQAQGLRSESRDAPRRKRARIRPPRPPSVWPPGEVGPPPPPTPPQT